MKVRLVYCWQHGRVTVVGKGVILLAGRAAAIENSNWRPPSQRDDCRLYTTNRVEDAADGSGKVREREGGMMKKKKKFLFFFFFIFFFFWQPAVSANRLRSISSAHTYSTRDKRERESLLCSRSHPSSSIHICK